MEMNYLEQLINETFKEELAKFAVEALGASQSFASQIASCKTNLDLKRLLRSESENVAEYVGFECECDEYDEYEIEELECEITQLQNQISDLKDNVIETKSYWDEQILKTFLKNRHRFTPWEFEERLK